MGYLCTQINLNYNEVNSYIYEHQGTWFRLHTDQSKF